MTEDGRLAEDMRFLAGAMNRGGLEARFDMLSANSRRSLATFKNELRKGLKHGEDTCHPAHD